MIEIVQVIARENHDLIMYFSDGKIKKTNVGNLAGKGVFQQPVKLLKGLFFPGNHE